MQAISEPITNTQESKTISDEGAVATFWNDLVAHIADAAFGSNSDGKNKAHKDCKAQFIRLGEQTPYLRLLVTEIDRRTQTVVHNTTGETPQAKSEGQPTSSRNTDQSAPTSSPEKMPDELALEQAWTGGRSDIIWQARMRATQVATNPELTYRFLTGPLRATLQVWEDEDRFDAETRVDLVLYPFQSLWPLMRKQPAAMIKLVAGLRGNFTNNLPPQITADWLSTLGGIADLCGRLTRTQTLKTSAFYYHEVLSILCHPNLKEFVNAVENHRLIRIQANNLVGRMTSLHKGSESEATPQFSQTINRVHSIAVLAASSGPREINSTQISNVMSIMAINASSDQAMGWSAMLSSMMNMPSAWNQLDPFIYGDAISNGWSSRNVAYISSMVPVLRLLINGNDDMDEVAQGFFNAGVRLSLMKGEEAIHDTEWIQATLAALGLWCALRLSADESECLDRLHGADCSVNTFGALTRTDHDSSLVNDGGAAHTLAQALMQRNLKDTNQERLNASWKELFGGSLQLASRPESLLEASNTYLFALLAMRDIKSPWDQPTSIPTFEPNHNLMRDATEQLAQLLARIWEKAVQPGEFVEQGTRPDNVQNLPKRVQQLLEHLSKERHDLHQTLANWYGDWAGKPLEIDERGYALNTAYPHKGLLGLTDVGEGPLTAASVTTNDEWLTVAQSAIVETPRTSLLFTPDRWAWLLR